MRRYLGIDCGSVSINLALMMDGAYEPITVYRRTRGRPLPEFVSAVDELSLTCGGNVNVDSALVTGSGRDLLSKALDLPTINEITAHATGSHYINPDIRTIIEIGGQDSKFITVAPSQGSSIPRVPVFRMNEICAAGTGAFLDEQAQRLGLAVESFGSVALQSDTPAPIAGRCAVFAKTDMMHQAQEGTPLPDILMGLAHALVRNYVATLIKGEALDSLVSLQGGVMANSAVVHAFRKLLDLPADHVVIPPHFKVLGAVGSAMLARRVSSRNALTLNDLKERARKAVLDPTSRSCLAPLQGSNQRTFPGTTSPLTGTATDRPRVLGLDVGSVSVKGVVTDGSGEIISQEYLLSRSRTFEAVDTVLGALLNDNVTVDAVAVTGSGRYLVGRLLDADLIVDEITAQSKAALNSWPEVDTVVEIGGQDSKWIALERGSLKDFEMNRVCAAGTGSFLMAQAQRLDLPMGTRFSDSAFSAPAPADLGSRCTVFMESDLIHHQNNGASSEDLAAGVCISIVQNYLERVANNKPLGDRILFLGGVAANHAVKAAFEQQTGRVFHTPEFFSVSGALGAALKALEKLRTGEIGTRERPTVRLEREHIRTEQFTCNGCTNRCPVFKYRTPQRTVYQGGLCDRWELEERPVDRGTRADLFGVRTALLDRYVSAEHATTEDTWGLVRSPQFFEWFPFWKGFLSELGISVKVAPRMERKQYERGLRFLRVETCVPMKAVAGQIEALVRGGVKTIFYPSILTELPPEEPGEPLEHCPYIQASSQFYRGAFDLEWKEPVISFALDHDSFRREHVRLALDLGFSRKRAAMALQKGMASLADYHAKLREAGEEFLNSLGRDEHALVVLGKPYHTADSFLNMNLGDMFHRLGIRAIPSDLFPVDFRDDRPEVYWKYQGNMVHVAREVAKDARLFPVMITFFGCGPDPFTLRHIRDNLGDKPLLILEMDEHTSRAGIITRIEAFLERIRQELAGSSPVYSGTVVGNVDACAGSERQSVPAGGELQPPDRDVRTEKTTRLLRAKTLYLPYMCDHSYGFAAAARSVGIDAEVLPTPDLESEQLGRPHMVGGECYPYALILGDYLKLVRTLGPDEAERSLFYIIGPVACRLGQYPVYIDKVRRKLGLGLGVISEVDQGLEAFGLTTRNRQRVYLRAWESLNAYDALLRAYLQVRPKSLDKVETQKVYLHCRNRLFHALIDGSVRQGIEDSLHELSRVPIVDEAPRPIISVTGDYYTRVVPFANNDVYREIEHLGGMILPPPTFSDSLKLGTLRDVTWSFLSGSSREAARKSMLYGLLALSEFKVKGSLSMKRTFPEPMDILGRHMWKTASQHAHTKLPAGITAPIVTALHHLDQGADGLLNLMTLNCSYATVVTAALSRALRDRPGVPMLTLVYDGLKKTNEKTRLEAFMEQVKDRFHCRSTDRSSHLPRAHAL